MVAPLRVALVSTWGIPCGIAEWSAYLVEAVQQADPAIAIEVVSDLHPRAILERKAKPDVVWLAYQAALLSQWHPEHIQAVQACGVKVGCTYHDSGVPNTDQAKGICAAADAFVLHEPYDDLDGNGRYWRMGVPDWQTPSLFDRNPNIWPGHRPILGSIGFALSWKNFDRLAELTAAVGWAFYLIAPDATQEQITAWIRLNPHTRVTTGFLAREKAVAHLSGCDATAFLYTCANTGQSGALLQGIAARKPVIAFSSCRQNRALYDDPLGREAIQWTDSFDGVAKHLRTLPIQRVDPGMVALAEQDGWKPLGMRYAQLLRELVGR